MKNRIFAVVISFLITVTPQLALSAEGSDSEEGSSGTDGSDSAAAGSGAGGPWPMVGRCASCVEAACAGEGGVQTL